MATPKAVSDYMREIGARGRAAMRGTDAAKARASQNVQKRWGIQGGKKGFADAINAAFYGQAGRVHNPTIRYSHVRGFHVESGIHPADPDVLWQHRCNFWASTGRPNIKVSEYSEVREAILHPEEA